MQDNHLYIACGLLGVLIHTLLKYQSLSEDAKKANISLPFGTFLCNDWAGILLAVLAVPLWWLVMPEVLQKYPSLTGYNRISFFMVGMLGSYLLQLVLSKSKKKVREVIDRKTDIADSKDNG